MRRLWCRLFGHRAWFEVMHDRLLVPPYRDYTRVRCKRCEAVIWDIPR